MSVDPTLFSSPGSLDGIVASLSDLDRRVNALSVSRTYFDPSTVSGGGSPGPGSITAAEIQTGSLQAADVLTEFLNSGTIETRYIVASSADIDKLQAAHIAAGVIDASLINVGSVSAAILTAGSIGASQITADVGFINKVISGMTVSGTLTATNGLSAVSGNLGTITAGTITGGKFFTAGSNPRVAMGTSMNLGGSFTNFTGLIGLDSTGGVTFKIDAATGAAQFKGTVLTGATGLGNFSDTLNPTTQIVDNTIPGGKIVTDSITATQIDVTTLTVNSADAASLRAGILTANSVNAAAIQAGSITADKVSFFSGGGINLIPDSSFEAGISRWAVGPNATGAQSAAQAVASTGVQSLALTCTAAGTIYAYHNGGTVAPTVRAIPGANYTGSFYVYGPAARTCQVAISFFDVAQALIRTDTGVAPAGAAAQASSVNAWVRIVGTSGAAPIGTASVRIQCTILGAAVSEVYYIDAVQLETGNVASGWSQYVDPTVIDGSTITGATIRTSAGTNRLEMSGSSFKAIIGGVNAVQLDSVAGLSLTAPDVATNVPTIAGGSPPTSAVMSWTISGRETGRVYSFDSSSYSMSWVGLYAPKSAGRSAFAQIGTPNGYIYVYENASDATGQITLATGGTNPASLNMYSNGDTTIQAGSGGVHFRTPGVSDGASLYCGNINCGAVSAYSLASTSGATSVFSGSVNFSNRLNFVGGGVNVFMNEQYGIYGHSSAGNQNFGSSGCAVIALASGSTNGASYTAGAGYFSVMYQYSDRGRKTNIRDWFTVPGSALARVKGLRPRRFDYLHTRGGNDIIGLVAQEVEEIDPELVATVTQPDGLASQAAVKTISPMAFTTLLIAASQELAEELSQLRKRVATLEAA